MMALIIPPGSQVTITNHPGPGKLPPASIPNHPSKPEMGPQPRTNPRTPHPRRARLPGDSCPHSRSRRLTGVCVCVACVLPGSRTMEFTSTLYIDGQDFRAVNDKDFFGLVRRGHKPAVCTAVWPEGAPCAAGGRQNVSDCPPWPHCPIKEKRLPTGQRERRGGSQGPAAACGHSMGEGQSCSSRRVGQRSLVRVCLAGPGQDGPDAARLRHHLHRGEEGPGRPAGRAALHLRPGDWAHCH